MLLQKDPITHVNKRYFCQVYSILKYLLCLLTYIYSLEFFTLWYLNHDSGPWSFAFNYRIDSIFCLLIRPQQYRTIIQEHNHRIQFHNPASHTISMCSRQPSLGDFKTTSICRVVPSNRNMKICICAFTFFCYPYNRIKPGKISNIFHFIWCTFIILGSQH